MTLIVDLDDTLIATTNLNNDAYNYALERFNFSRINKTARITRKDLSYIQVDILEKIIKEKQSYFIKDWMQYRLILNKKLLEKIKSNKKENNVLWTSAAEERAKIIIERYNLKNYFKYFIFDNKQSFSNSVENIKRICNSNEFIIYENNKELFNKNKKHFELKKIDSIKNLNFDIIGFRVDLRNKA